MEKAGVLEDMKPDGDDEDSIGDGSLATCAADFCDSGVSGYESYVSAIFQWVHEQVVPIGVMAGVLGMLEFLQFCACLGMLFTDQANLESGYNKANEWAKQEQGKLAGKMRDPTGQLRRKERPPEEAPAEGIAPQMP